MKLLTQRRALEKLLALKTKYQRSVRGKYEHNAKDCLTCKVNGSCCLDAHFVNVHITRLEAVAIQAAIKELKRESRNSVNKRVDDTIEKYDLVESETTFSKTFACPLFEKETGCLVHEKGKPVPCIQHACYENRDDIPPDELRIEQEKAVERLNRQTYGNAWNWLPLPVWLKRP